MCWFYSLSLGTHEFILSIPREMKDLYAVRTITRSLAREATSTAEPVKVVKVVDALFVDSGDIYTRRMDILT